MPTPTGTVLVSLTGTKLKPNNKPESGVLIFKLLSTVPVGITSSVPAQFRRRFDSTGHFSADLLTSTDDTTYPNGWTYRIDTFLDDGGYQRAMYNITHAMAPTVDISTLTPVTTPSELSQYATRADLDALNSRIAGNHVQYTAATAWAINHNLGYHPSFTVYDTTNEETTPDVEKVTDNQAVLHFTNAVAGIAFYS